MIKRNFLIVILLTTFSLVGVSQTFERTINWKQKIEITDENGNRTFLQFDNAEYNNLRLPVYSELLPFKEEGKNYSLKLENVEFIALSAKEIEGIKNLETLKTTLVVQSGLVNLREKQGIQLSFVPLRKSANGQGYEKVVRFSIHLKEIPLDWSANKNNTYNSVLSTGNWFKFKTATTGIHKLTFSELQNMGITNLSKVRIFGNSTGMLSFMNSDERPDDLQELKFKVENSTIYFYATGANRFEYSDYDKLFLPIVHLYADYSYYYITDTYDSGFDNKISTQLPPTETETLQITDYDAFRYHEENTYNLARSGRTWYGNRFDAELSQDFNFSFSNIKTDTPINSQVLMAAYSPISSKFTITSGGESKQLYINGSGKYRNASTGKAKISYLPTSSNLSYNITYNRISNAEIGWLDKIVVNATCYLKFTTGQMPFLKYLPENEGEIVKYKISNINSNTSVWDITDPTKPEKVELVGNNTTKTFKTKYNKEQQFIAFDGAYYSPIISGAGTGSIANQNLHATPGSTDYIIITHPNFASQAEEIAEIHRAEGLEVLVTTPSKIYNEFSSGMPDVSAMRDFVKMVYDRGQGNDKLKYLLLLGDGSYDNKSTASSNSNFILTYQSENSVSQTLSYVTDDFFGLLDPGEGASKGFIDIGIGRLPVSTVKEANEAVNKIRNYMAADNKGGWRNTLCFIADDEDSNVHMRDANIITEDVASAYPDFNIEKIYFDAYPQIVTSVGQRYPDVNEAFTNRVVNGSLIINYTGHGGEYGLGHERILTNSDIESWENLENLPLFVTATCEFSRFDNYEMRTSGERVFLNPNGGAIAMFTTTRLVYVSPNFRLNQAFYRHVFEKDENGNPNRLGDIIRKTKNEISGDNKRNFTLLGDPALNLLYGQNQIKITTVNGANPRLLADTLQALGHVVIKGEVQNNRGKMQNFNGFVDIKVFDKIKSVKTLNNDVKHGAFNYEVRNNAIYNGTSQVVNGEFEVEFIVPKDIRQNIGIGKISTYAYSQQTDAKGSNFDVFVGGYADDFVEDDQGPEIELFMNDDNFVSGGITDKNPMIFAKIFDESGINTVGNGIGHDITAIIDGNTTDVIVLNNDYQSVAGSFQDGTVSRFLYGLENGEHDLTLKVWDVHNNSSSASIDFIVLDSEALVIENLMNAPNPFYDNTKFYFEHNKAGETLKVDIKIFSLSGMLVGQITKTVDTEGYRAGPFSTKTDADLHLSQGIYVYRVAVTAESGVTVTAAEKMIVVKE